MDVTTAIALDDHLREIITTKTAKDLGTQVVLREHIDKSILGGIIMSAPLDQDIITNGYTADHAAVAAIAAGCDLLYRPEHFELAVTGVVEAVENGVLTEERIEQSLRRILRVKYKMGL